METAQALDVLLLRLAGDGVIHQSFISTGRLTVE